MDYHRVIHALERPYGDAKRYSECTCTDEMWGIVLAYAFQTCILLHQLILSALKKEIDILPVISLRNIK